MKDNFKLEHRKEEVLPLKHFFSRLGRYFLFCLLFIGVSLAVGTLGYVYFAGVGWLDSFYMSCMILTGMGPVIDLKGNDTGKWFSSFYALYSGIAFLGITAVFFTPVIHRLLHILHVESDEKKD